MKWLLKGLLAIVIIALVIVAGLYATGRGSLVTLTAGYIFGRPSLPFDPQDAVAAPDYADAQNWAALPGREDLADLIPQGIADTDMQGSAPVDVFFIHPTGFLKGSSWTSPMDADSSTEENTSWMMANQASAYNGCCNVYAPRYREASIFAYFMGPDIREQVLGFAYQDVERAFAYFLQHYSDGRPFVIASHSQGTNHGARLLKEKIDGTPLAQRLVAAYIIGGGIETSHFDDMKDIGVCQDATQLHCAVHWDTFSDALLDDESIRRPGNLCVNPLSWEHAGGLAGKELHKGAVPGSGEFHLAIMGSDAARGVEFGPLGAPLPKYVEARCAHGLLYITDQSDTPFGKAGAMGDSYHGLDYPMFHMDIRDNARLRVATYLQTYPAP